MFGTELSILSTHLKGLIQKHHRTLWRCTTNRLFKFSPHSWPFPLTYAILAVKAFDLGDATHNFEGESTIRLRLPVLGPAGRGHYSLVAEKAEANIVLVRSDLEVEETKSLLPEQFEGKKMIIYARERHGDIKNYVEGGGSVNGST